MAAASAKSTRKSGRGPDAWRAALDGPHAAARLADLIAAAVGDARAADAATTERALGFAARALAPFHSTRGRSDAERLIEVIVERWPWWPSAPSPRDAFLLHALAVVAARGAVARLLLDVVPDDATVAVRVNVACLHAAAGEAAPLARAIEAALDAGATPDQLRAERELAAVMTSPSIVKLLAKRSK